MQTKKLLVIASALLLALAYPLTGGAGSVSDVDGDTVPDVFDNCPNDPNGPNELSNQVDTDGDGFGNACDCDFVPPPGDGAVAGDDIVDLFSNFNTASALHDIDGDGAVSGSDVVACFSRFNMPPG